MGANGFLGRDAHEDDDPGTHHHPGEEIGTRRRSRRRGTAPEEGQQLPQGLTVERLAGVIADLPPSLPRESAVLIVRKTLDAADVELSEVDASTREQEVRLSSEIGLVENRQKELREKTQETVRSLEEEIRKAQETVRSLEEEIRKAREACDEVVTYEERKISHDRALLRKVRRVRDFFGLAKAEREEDADPAERGTQQILEPSDAVVRRRIFQPPFGPGTGGG
jgi:multidrug efflux pump subunit AcrA (membrane-fusion protein)